MNLALKLAASVATVAAVSTAAWFAASPRVSTPADAAADQPPAASSAAPPDAGEEPVVCVGSDTILRAPISNGECAAGETRYALESGKPPDCDDCNPWAGPRSRSSGSDRLATLEERVNQLERSPLFTVMNESGKPILTVSPGMVRRVAA